MFRGVQRYASGFSTGDSCSLSDGDEYKYPLLLSPHHLLSWCFRWQWRTRVTSTLTRLSGSPNSA